MPPITMSVLISPVLLLLLLLLIILLLRLILLLLLLLLLRLLLLLLPLLVPVGKREASRLVSLRLGLLGLLQAGSGLHQRLLNTFASEVVGFSLGGRGFKI